MSQVPTASQILAAVQEGRMTPGQAVRALKDLGFTDAQATTAIRDVAPSRTGDPGPVQPTPTLTSAPAATTPGPTPPGQIPVTPGDLIGGPGDDLFPAPIPTGTPGPLAPGPFLAPLGNTTAPLTPLQQQQISQSASRGGRGQIFDAILAGQGFSPLGQSLAGQAFNPLSASFALNQVLNPTIDPNTGDVGGANFANFLPNFLSGQGATQLPTQSNFLGKLNEIASFFGNPNQSQQTGINAFLGPQNATDPQGTARNIISQSFLSGINPLFRGSGQSIINNILNSFLGSNPASDLFGAFLGGQLGGGQGIFANRLPFAGGESLGG